VLCTPERIAQTMKSHVRCDGCDDVACGDAVQSLHRTHAGRLGLSELFWALAVAEVECGNATLNVLFEDICNAILERDTWRRVVVWIDPILRAHEALVAEPSPAHYDALVGLLRLTVVRLTKRESKA
jgi:hypothetical protein